MNELLNKGYAHFLHEQLGTLSLIERCLDMVEMSQRDTNELRGSMDRIISMAKALPYKGESIDIVGLAVNFINSMRDYLRAAPKMAPILVHDKLIEFENRLVEISPHGQPDERQYISILGEISNAKTHLSSYFMQQSVTYLAELKRKTQDMLMIEKEYMQVVNAYVAEEVLPFDILALLNQVVDTKSFNLDLRRLEIRKRIYIKEGFVLGTKPEILKVFLDLFGNAIKYSRTMPNNKAWIELKVNEISSYIVIDIENWGIGIKQSEISDGTIFRSGQRGYYPKLLGIEGNGLGLSNAKHVIEKNGGAIQVKCRPAKNEKVKHNENSNYITTVTVKLKKYIGESSQKHNPRKENSRK